MFSLTNAVYTRQLQIPKVASFYVPYQNYGSNSEVINSNSNGDVKSEITLLNATDYNLEESDFQNVLGEARRQRLSFKMRCY